ncbi:site-specific DNA-methyltransferase [Myxococcus faecalis]|uniref:site-specific DNA-methyltransferase n=1 Tax=Myxococcus faecalis TaxID=3115646 RepID=UPI003CE77A5D
MERKELAASVPTQVVEIVRPGRALERKGELELAARASGRDEVVKPENRLIWTNDNFVALQTLLDERDPKTRDYRYRGKIDLVYIDPPFMVNNDFRADNSIDIELDDEEGVQAKKEPSLVEILAYKDTWRQGLDSFLSMLRARLALLKQLLAPTGSIYVHLDWHAVHYVKVLMDEIFGYENMLHEVIWKRTSARSDAQGFNHIHDVILGYSQSGGAYWNPVYAPLDADYVRSKYNNIDSKSGKRYRLDNLTSPNPRPNMMYEYDGFPAPENGWRFDLEKMKEMDDAGLIVRPTGRGKRLQFKRFLDDEGMPLSSVWSDIPPVNSQARERLGYPTQKPVGLIERIITASCPPGGLILDCFMGSGTTAEAAERLGRRWIGIDNGKYAIHLARKRLIQLQGQPRSPEKPSYDYVECKTCKNIERKSKPQRSPGPYTVRPFTVENMGVYQRAAEWQGFQQHRSAYRDEMIKVFGGEPVDHSPLLHGRKGNTWVHVGPLDGPVSSAQVWSIAREAQRTSTKAVTVLSADFDTLSASDKDEIKKKTGVVISIRVIPANAIDEVKRRLDLQRVNPNIVVESTAIPAFYAPLSIVLEEHAAGRNVELRLKRCEVDIESFIASQRPLLKPITDKMTPAAKKKAQGEIDRWEKREQELNAWLKKATSWRAFVDFWSIDWNYGRQVGEDGKPIFITEWQSFRNRDGNGDGELVFAAKFSYPQAGHYRIAARVTDVFGNDGIATVDVEVKR